MNNRWYSRVVLGLLLGMLSVSAAEDARGPVYVIPVQGMIERGLVYVIRRGVAQAVRDKAEVIILDMDTPGGRLDSTEEIINIIADLDAVTYTFVNSDAISAGAIISMATDHIYMAPGGRIGDAMPIMMSPLPFGGPQEMPDGLKEKAISPTVALIRSAAQRKGHDPELAEAMVRPELEYKIGEEVICEAGQLLTLTSHDATRRFGEEQRPLLSEGIVKDLPELLATIGYGGVEPVAVTSTSAERIARFIEGFPMSGIILAAGLILLYIEYKTPGFGIPGIAGILLLGVWFWGHQIAGLAGMGEILIFLLGIVLLFVEIFLIPGFGFVGLSGMALILVSLVMAMVEHYPGVPWYQPAGLSGASVQTMVLNMGVGLLLTFLGGVLLARVLPETRAFQRLMLNKDLSAGAGYLASAPTDDLLGLTGVAGSALRPAGIGVFGDRRLNVVTRGEFIDKDQPIVVAETHGNRIVVESPDDVETT